MFRARIKICMFLREYNSHLFGRTANMLQKKVHDQKTGSVAIIIGDILAI